MDIQSTCKISLSRRSCISPEGPPAAQQHRIQGRLCLYRDHTAARTSTGWVSTAIMGTQQLSSRRDQGCKWGSKWMAQPWDPPWCFQLSSQVVGAGGGEQQASHSLVSWVSFPCARSICTAECLGEEPACRK